MLYNIMLYLLTDRPKTWAWKVVVFSGLTRQQSSKWCFICQGSQGKGKQQFYQKITSVKSREENLLSGAKFPCSTPWLESFLWLKNRVALQFLLQSRQIGLPKWRALPCSLTLILLPRPLFDGSSKNNRKGVKQVCTNVAASELHSFRCRWVTAWLLLEWAVR